MSTQGQVRVTDDGIALPTGEDVALDVLFEGRRVWSFWSVRDTKPGSGGRFVAWPPPLRRFLDGTVELSLVEHVSGEAWFTGEVLLGSGEGRIEVVDSHGRPLGLDKSNQLSRLFESRTPEQVAPLMQAIDTVLAALAGVGIEAFLAYGTLLGAVRQGGLISHDSDADLGYVSHHSEPVDAIIESFRIQRMLIEQGYTVTRYSGIAFRVTVLEADGTRRGLDVFGGLINDGHLYLMGEVGAPFEPEWIWPLSEATLEGRSFPVPARPEKLLEAMYGVSWQVPDPAYKFETALSTERRLNGWFRGTRGGRNLDWTSDGQSERRGKVKPSSLAAWVQKQAPEGEVVDLGTGRGRDAFWFAKTGRTTWGLDFLPLRYRALQRRARRQELPLTYRWTNFNELRSSLAVGAEIAVTPGPRTLVARHVFDALDRPGRENLTRLAELLLRDGGRLYLQVQVRPGRALDGLGPIRPVRHDRLLELLESRGARVLSDEKVTDPSLEGSAAADVRRMVVSWE